MIQHIDTNLDRYNIREESKLISKLPSSNLGIANWGVNVLEDMNFSF